MEDLQFVISRVQLVLDNKKISANKAFLESGVGKDFIANMRKGMTPSVDKFSDLSDYLGVSIDYLVGRTDAPDVNK